MLTRRRFLSRGSLALLGAAGTCLAVPGDNPPEAGSPEQLPDGSAAKGMITPKTDQAIEKGLTYLATHRHRDGSFGTGMYRGNVAVTSLGALAFMAAGHQPNRGSYGRIVTEAVKFILAQENRGGGQPGFIHNPQATPHGPMYGHGFATLFLAEVSGMIPDKELAREVDTKLRRAVKLILSSQNIEGGWRYTPTSKDADLSVTICQIMALRAARNAGVEVPEGKVNKCVDYVKRCQDRRNGWFRYMQQGGGGGGQQAFARTAAGVAALFSAGVYKGAEVDAGLRFLMDNKPALGFFGRPDIMARPDMHYYYGHYYAVQAMWIKGGTYWSEWYPYIRDELLNNQRQDGCWQDQICTHYATAMACIILQVPNNYLPIMQK
jgi:hypothetical protein